MTCIKDLIDSKLFKLPECREILLPVFCEQIKSKLENKEEVSFSKTFINFFLTVYINMRVNILYTCDCSAWFADFTKLEIHLFQRS